MNAADVPRGVAAGMATAAALGLPVDDADVLNDSNRPAVRLRLGAVLVRVAHEAQQAVAEFEVEVARGFAEADAPVEALDPRVEPRVYVRDGFAVTLWTYYEPVPPRAMTPFEYAGALDRLHSALRHVELGAPHFTDRVAAAQRLVEDRVQTPDLADADRELLDDTLRGVTNAIRARGGTEQLLHGEPHPGNLLRTEQGLLFVDLETCCRGPVEFDIAHAPEEVGRQMRVDEDLLRDCRILVLAMIATWRWDRDDQFPNGRALGTEWLRRIRALR